MSTAVLLVALAVGAACGQDEPARTSTTVSLAGSWSLLLDPGAVGLDEDWAGDLCAGRTPPAAPSEPFPIDVPGPLEGAEATALFDLETATGYDGVVWYSRRFSAPAELGGARSRLRFEQVNHSCRAWLDGVPIGEHAGGYDPFAFEITEPLRPGAEHVLVLMVLDAGAVPTLGLTLATTPHAKESWYHNWGGILGDVALHVDHLPTVERLALQVDGRGGSVRWHAHCELPPGWRSADFAFRVDVRGPSAERGDAPTLIVSTACEPIASGDTSVSLEGELVLPDPRWWSPESPALYELEIVAIEGGVASGEPSTLKLGGRPSRSFGLRTFEFRDGDVFLNGERRRLHGVLYQPHFAGTGGVTPSAEELERVVAEIKATGFDLVRAHVRPAPEAFLDACDRQGLLVLQEPAIGWVEDDPGLRARLEREIDWMVARDRHHPSIVMWGVLNEMSGKGYRYGHDLTRRLARLDPTRPVLVDSGGFLDGGRYAPARPDAALLLDPAAALAAHEPVPLAPMRDEHVYPPYPLPLDERERMRTLGADEPGPVFVSEFGYGTVMDTAAAFAGYRERGVRDEEFALFKGYDGNARRARERGETWRAESWHPEAHELQADAAEDMIEALRANPALDLLCYTQWQAVSSEPSAGVLDAWGNPRPVRERIRHALRPLTVSLFPESGAFLLGDRTGRVDVVIVNDTGTAVSASVELWATPVHWSGRLDTYAMGQAFDRRMFAPGVTVLRAELPRPRFSPDVPTSLIRLDASLRDGGRVLDTATPRDVRRKIRAERVQEGLYGPGTGMVDGSTGDVVGPHVPLRVWVPPGHESVHEELDAWGVGLAETPETATGGVLLSRPERFAADVSLAEQLRVWQLVHAGSTAVVLLPDPIEDDVARLLGMGRGVLTVPALPVSLPVARATGNFMGRVHVARRWVEERADYARDTFDRPTPHFYDRAVPPSLLGRGDESLSPVAMVRGPLPEGSEELLVTLGHNELRAGTPWVRVPFGDGWIVCVGFARVEDGAPRDLRRSGLLGRLLSHESYLAAVSWAERHVGADEPWPPPWQAPTAEQLARLDQALQRVRRYATLCERASPFVMGPRRTALPGNLQPLLDAKNAALLQVLEGDASAGLDALTTLLTGLWSDELETFLALEQRVRDGFAALVQDGELAQATSAHDVLEHWARGLVAWFDGEPSQALDWLGQAESLLESPR